MEFLRKFFIDGFVSGDYTYGIIHILSLIILMASIIGLSIYFWNKDSNYINKKLKIIAIISLSIYLFRRFIWFLNGDSFIRAFWPFYLCNINTIFLCIYQIFGLKKGKDFFLVTGLLGGAFTFIMPNGIYNDKYLTYGVLDSVLSHYVIVVIPLVLLITKAHKLKFKGLIDVLIGLIIVVINSELIQDLLFSAEYDYLFFRSNLPFTIPGVPQFYIISSLTIILVSLVYFIDYIYLTKTNSYELNYES